MKSILLLLAVLALGLAGEAATISGYVYLANATRNVPVCNKTIYVVDSNATHYYLDSVLSEYDGHYSYTIPSTTAFGNLRVYIDVNYNIINASQIVSYSGANITGINFWATLNNYCPLWGKTTIGGSPNTGPTKLYLIAKAYDPMVMDTTLTAIDSFFTIGNTGTYHRVYTNSVYTLSNGGASALLVKAALMPTHASYSSYLPAYASNSLTWSGAKRLDSSSNIASPFTGSQFFTADIDLPAGVNPGGNGFIGGSVLLGANKAAAVGDPLPGKILLLTTAAGKAVGYTYSNVNGVFSFSNLANGSYLLFGDVWGKGNPPLAVTISGSAPTVRNIIFEENSSEFKGHYNVVSVSAEPGLPSVSVAPNPASSYVQLQGLTSIEGDKQITLYDFRGLAVSSTHIQAGANASIPVSQLPAGMYMMQVQTLQGSASYKFVRQ